MLVITFATKKGLTQIGATVDGKPFLITIAGKPFWMPQSVRTEITPSRLAKRIFRFEAGYSNYRKFDVTSGIVN